MDIEKTYITRILSELIRIEREEQGRYKIYEEKLNDKYWKSDYRFLKTEIGLIVMRKRYIKYLKNLLEERLKIIEKENKKEEENIQLKI